MQNPRLGRKRTTSSFVALAGVCCLVCGLGFFAKNQNQNGTSQNTAGASPASGSASGDANSQQTASTSTLDSLLLPLAMVGKFAIHEPRCWSGIRLYEWKIIFCKFLSVFAVPCELKDCSIRISECENHCHSEARVGLSFATLYTFGAEVFPTSVRGTAMSFQSSASRVAGMVAAPILGAGSVFAFLVFGALCFVAFVACEAVLPETLHQRGLADGGDEEVEAEKDAFSGEKGGRMKIQDRSANSRSQMQINSGGSRSSQQIGIRVIKAGDAGANSYSGSGANDGNTRSEEIRGLRGAGAGNAADPTGGLRLTPRGRRKRQKQGFSPIPSASKASQEMHAVAE